MTCQSCEDCHCFTNLDVNLSVDRYEMKIALTTASESDASPLQTRVSEVR